MIGHSGPCDGGPTKCVACRAREPLTADTITAERIREARRLGWIDESLLRSALPDASNAFAGEVGVAYARARCAEILNARARVK